MRYQVTIPRTCALAMTICFLFLIGGFLLSGQAGSPDTINPGTDAGDQTVFSRTREDLNTDPAQAQEIDLSQAPNLYTITDAGSYILTGDYEGQISIDAEEQIVHLFLKNVHIHSRSGPAVVITSAGKVVITLTEGSDNTVRDSAHYRGSGHQDAAVYSSCDLTINGSGSLSLYGYYREALHSRDLVKILGGDIFIQAMGHGIQGNDGILIDTDSLRIESKKSGLCTTKTGNNNKGTIEISGGDISIIAGEYAVSSSGDLYVRNCSVWTNSVLGQLETGGKRFLTEGCLNDE